MPMYSRFFFKNSYEGGLSSLGIPFLGRISGPFGLLDQLFQSGPLSGRTEELKAQVSFVYTVYITVFCSGQLLQLAGVDTENSS